MLSGKLFQYTVYLFGIGAIRQALLVQPRHNLRKYGHPLQSKPHHPFLDNTTLKN